VLHCEQVALRPAEIPVPLADRSKERFNEIKRKHLLDTFSPATSALPPGVASGKRELKQEATAKAGRFQELKDE
jgi:hypothetical protein